MDQPQKKESKEAPKDEGDIDTLVLMDEILDKLKLLDYEAQFLRKQ